MRIVDRAKAVGLVDGFINGKDRVSVSHLQFVDESIFLPSREESKVVNLPLDLRIF